MTMNGITVHSRGLAHFLSSRIMSVQDKVKRYEEFVNERLRTDLQTVLKQRDQVYSDIAELTQLQSVITQLESTQGPLKTMVDIGCNTYAQAQVKDPSKICVSVGLGFYLEMNLMEASCFVKNRISELHERAMVLTQQSSEINARIKIVLGALHELQFSSGNIEPPHVHIW